MLKNGVINWVNIANRMLVVGSGMIYISRKGGTQNG